MPKPSVRISMNTHHDISSEEHGRRFAEALIRAGLAPERVSTSDYFKDPFVSPEHFAKRWWAMRVEMRVDGVKDESYLGPSWQRRSAPAGRGYVTHGSINLRNNKIPSGVWFDSRWSAKTPFLNLFEEWVEFACPYIAILHLFTEPEQQKAKSEPERMFQLGGWGSLARRTVQNLGWATAFGDALAEEVDVEKIRRAGFPVKSLGGAWVVQVTDNLSDVALDFPNFSRRRAELKSLFRAGMFEIEREPLYSV